jgi:hypothetical protein
MSTTQPLPQRFCVQAEYGRLAESRRCFWLTGFSCLVSFIYRDGTADNQTRRHGPSAEQQEERA